MVSVDAFYRWGLTKVQGMDFPILHQKMDIFNRLEFDEFGDPTNAKPIFERVDDDEFRDFDFMDDEVIETERLLNPMKVVTQDNLRYSIINTIAYVLGEVIGDYMLRFTKGSNSFAEGKKCLIIMKNEYLLARAMLTMQKKNYASKQELQEGNFIPEKESLDVKGLALNKPPLTPGIRKELKKILFDDILNTDKIDQVKVIKDLAILEKKIFYSLKNGEKKYYKTISIKSLDHYDDPMRIQGIKASIVWNTIKDNDSPAIDLSDRNAIDIVKVNINISTVEKIKDLFPETYNKIIEILKDDIYKGCITSLALPKDSQVPEWLQYFIDYTTIINDNISCFPLESIGVSKLENGNLNYTNIIQI